MQSYQVSPASQTRYFDIPDILCQFQPRIHSLGISQWWQESTLHLGLRVSADITAGALLLVDSNIEWNCRKLEGYHRDLRLKLQNGFFACPADHQIESNRDVAERMSDAASLLQQGENS
jgi:hypothetical protein